MHSLFLFTEGFERLGVDGAGATAGSERYLIRNCFYFSFTVLIPSSPDGIARTESQMDVKTKQIRSGLSRANLSRRRSIIG